MYERKINIILLKVNVPAECLGVLVVSGLGSSGKGGIGVGAIAAAHFFFGPKVNFILFALGFRIFGLQQTKQCMQG